MKYRLKPEIAKRVCDRFGVNEEQLSAAPIEFFLVAKKTETEGCVFDSVFLMTLRIGGRTEHVALTRDEIDVKEDRK